MNIKLQKSLLLALGYTFFLFATLYFLPFLTGFLREHDLLKKGVDIVYILFGIFLLLLFIYRYRIRRIRAYLWFALLTLLFLFEFFNTPRFIERFHYLEYALLYVLWFRVFRHFFHSLLRFGIPLWTGALIGILDESIQDLLPNRYFEWNDIALNINGLLFGMAAVAVFTRYREDGKRK